MRKNFALTLLLIIASAFTASSQVGLASEYHIERYLNWRFNEDTVTFLHMTVLDKFGVDSNGNILEIKSVPYNWPAANASGVLTNNGSGGLSWAAASVGSGNITGLTEDQVLFGAADGSIDQSSLFTYGPTFSGVGVGLTLSNTAADPNSYTTLTMSSTNGWNYFNLSSAEASYLYFQNLGLSSKWIVGHDVTGGLFKIDNSTDDEDLHLDAFNYQLLESEGGQVTTYDAGGWTFQSPETLFSGEIGIGLTTAPDFDIEINQNGRVEVVATGYGTSKTIFGARFANGTYASPSAVTTGQDIGEFGAGGYKATTFTTSSVAHMKITSTENWTDAATGAKMVLATTPNGTTGSVTAVTINQDQSVDFADDVTVTGNFVAANVASGTYSPTITSISNLDATTTAQCQYIRVGNVVTVSGVIEIDPTSSALTEFRITLPVSSNITAVTNLAGEAIVTAATTRYSLQCQGDVTNDAAYFSGYTTFNANNATSIMFTYLIQ